jgi:hypothetical protein
MRDDVMAPERRCRGGQHCGAEVVTSGRLNGSNFADVVTRAQSRGGEFGGESTDRWGSAISDQKVKTITGHSSCRGGDGGKRPKEFFRFRISFPI